MERERESVTLEHVRRKQHWEQTFGCVLLRRFLFGQVDGEETSDGHSAPPPLK